MTAHPISRRTILRTSAVGAAGVGASAVIAACSSSSIASPNSARTSSPTDSVAARATSAGEGSATAPSAVDSTNPAGSGLGTKVAALADIPVGSSKSATLDGKPIVLTQTTTGTVAGFSAVCPHEGCTVAPKSTSFNCPCHGSTFNSTTGARLTGPAQTGLTALKITVSGEAVYAEKA